MTATVTIWRGSRLAGDSGLEVVSVCVRAYILLDGTKAKKAAAPRRARSSRGTSERARFCRAAAHTHRDRDRVAVGGTAVRSRLACELDLEFVSAGVRADILPGGTGNLIARHEETTAIRGQANTAELLAGTIARDVEEQIRRRPVTRR